VTEPPTRDFRTDEQLVAGINRGDVSAFGTLYDRYRAWAHAVAFRFTRNEHDAADLVQDAFAYLLRLAPNLSLRCRFTTYLYPILRNGALTLHRKRGRETELRIDIAASLTRPPESTGDLRHFANIIDRLPEPHREVLLMRFVDEMTQREIASALGIPIGTVKSRLHHALKLVRADPAMRTYFP